MCRYPQGVGPDESQTERLPREQGVVDVCIWLLGLKVVIGLLEHGIVEVFILIRGHGCFFVFC